MPGRPVVWFELSVSNGRPRLTSPEPPFVVTRPAPDHRKLMARLDEAGIDAIHSPAFEIEQVPEPLLGNLMDDLKAFDLVLVTSPVAARLIARRASGLDTQELRFLAPGQGSASVLEAVGIRCRFPESGGTSEDILAMPEFSGIEGVGVAIVGAPGGRGLLASELSRRGARVEAVHVYRRKPVAPAPALIDALRQGSAAVVLISSRQAFDMIGGALAEELRPAWLGSRFVVSSERLERVCREAGVSRIRRASGAADELMLAAALEAGWMRG